MLRGDRGIDPDRELRRAFKEMIAAEEWIAGRQSDLDGLGRSVLNLSLPDHQSRPFFADSALIQEPELPAKLDSLLDGGSGADETSRTIFSGLGVSVSEIPIEESAATIPRDDIQLWKPLLQNVRYFERANFKIKEAPFDLEAVGPVESLVLFGGVAYLHSGAVIEVKTKLHVRWKNSGEDSSWIIDQWRTDHMEIIASPRKLFAETLDQAIPDPAILEAARKSIHEERITQIVQGKANKSSLKPIQAVGAVYHPGLSVVDFDSDGFDDFYLMARWGENRFFRNRGDGTFEEIAEHLGLNIDGATACGLFADFDNDGDADVLLGRIHLPCVYLRNDAGRFVDATADSLPSPPPILVTSLSAADYNGDGLLDVYLSTYGSDKQRALLSPDDRQLYDQQKKLRNDFLSRPGPPNVLLKNLGEGVFGRAGLDEIPSIAKRTFQSTWSDYDRDGDPDLYVSSDYAPNNLFQNDGKGTFVDVTAETSTADIGLGMGASWGDYDNDGWPDLYTTNMYSKAGLRITRKIPGLKLDLLYAAHGNSLFRNPGDGSATGKAAPSSRQSREFEKVSGLAHPALLVESAGWGWGGQFLDVDNDGYLDIHALSGYYTAPKKVAQPGDT